MTEDELPSDFKDRQATFEMFGVCLLVLFICHLNPLAVVEVADMNIVLLTVDVLYYITDVTYYVHILDPQVFILMSLSRKVDKVVAIVLL